MDAGEQVSAAHHPLREQARDDRGAILGADQNKEEARFGYVLGAGGPEAVPVAIDIETLGLVAPVRVTCICIWDGKQGREWVIRSCANGEPNTEDLERARVEVAHHLRVSPLIYAFNGLGFDLPHLAKFLGLEPELGGWIKKLVDPLDHCKALLGTNKCMKLDHWLMQNGLPTKSASGLEAITMYLEGRYDDLADYCMRDTELTHVIITKAKKSCAWDHMLWCPWEPSTMFK